MRGDIWRQCCIWFDMTEIEPLAQLLLAGGEPDGRRSVRGVEAVHAVRCGVSAQIRLVKLRARTSTKT